jgi:kynureninase
MADKLTDAEKRELQRAYKDASAKLAALPDRIRDEDQQAEVDRRDPVTIEPLTEIKAPLVVKAIATINDNVSPELADIIGAQRRSCSVVGNVKVCLYSEQLKLILEAAGISDAQV